MIRKTAITFSIAAFLVSGCNRWKSTDAQSQMSATSAFEWGQYIMSIIPVNISPAASAAADPHICLYEVNWDHDWTDNPKMWHAIYARHINALSFDKTYTLKYSQKSKEDAEFLKSIVRRFNVACGASGLNQLCTIPAKLEDGIIARVSRFLADAYTNRRKERDKEFALAVDAADVEVSKSADHLLLINRIKQMPANTKNGKNCLEHAFDPSREIARMREISRHFKPRTKLK
ncbi:MAG: hypothetical protein RL189_280 [Pseudomonadota bacterium]|jgi:hypothetical protein